MVDVVICILFYYLSIILWFYHMYVVNAGKYTYIEEYNYFGNVIKLIINDMFQLIECHWGVGEEGNGKWEMVVN